jgi:hypothetical protein
MIKLHHQEAPGLAGRDDRLDFVKAISIVLVLIWHLKPLRIVTVETPSTFIKLTRLALEQMYLSLTLVAVPLFILTSLFLLFQKLQYSNYKYLQKRCWRLLEVFGFWFSFQFFIYYVVELIQSTSSNLPFSLSPNLNIGELVTGTKPALPIVEDSVFYFLLVILELTVISYLLFSWEKVARLKNYTSVAIIIILLVYFEVLNLSSAGISYWRLDNFLIYIPLAYLLVKREKIERKYILALWLLFLIFGIQDVLLRRITYEIGVYSRISVICGALAIFSSCINLSRHWQAPKHIKFLAKFSLGIFALHKYWQLLMAVSIPQVFQALGISMELFKIDISAIFIAIATTLLTFGSVRLLDRTPLQKFIK